MSSKTIGRAPILVVGVGNTLLKEDGVGIELVTRLSAQADRWGDAVEFLEGGTRGMALLDYLSRRRAIIFFDAVELGVEPGTLHLMERDTLLALGSRSTSAHEGNAAELLRIAKLLGDLPENLFLIGIEPEIIGTGIELSERVQAAIPAALQMADSKINSIAASLRDI